MKNEEHSETEASETLLEIIERGRLISQGREEKRIRQEKKAEIAELLMLFVLLTALLLSLLFWR